MSRLTLATWNAEGMFVAGSLTRRGTPDGAVSVLSELDADIVGIPEFGIIDRLTQETRRAIEALGYEIHTTHYHDERHPGYGLALLCRKASATVEPFPLGDGFRDALVCTIQDEAGRRVRICSVHLDDRTDESRVNEMRQLVDQLNKESIPTVVMGDFNTMSERSLLARAVRLPGAGLLERMMPATVQSVFARLRMMASGASVTYLCKHMDVRDLDPRHQLTISAKQAGMEWMPSIRLAKIDWMFGSTDFSVESYRVWRDVGSDHRPVRADLYY